MAKAKKIELPTSEDFQNAVDLLALYSDVSNQLEALQADTNNELLDLLDEKKADYAKLQEILTKAETALEVLARKHPDWFSADRRSIKTPYGTMKLHASTKLEVKNEELTVVLIQQEIERQAAAAVKNPDYRRPFDATTFLRTSVGVNIEALEQLDDATLKQFRIERVKRDNFSVSPAKLDMGKAVAEAIEGDKKAA